ncbi:MAG TPA: hypothetical protein VFH31_09775, partial [Pyrinomonadaceae bacterium]|nr:hypothetical protein [Pyrinomonadaceae bacterium]
PFWPDPEIHSIFGDTPTPERIRKLGGVAPYLSPAFERLQASHIKNYLSHVNPYTGKTYAEETVFAGWELTNENKFIPCMFSAQCIKELPPALLDQLKHLWSKWQDDQGEGANKSETLPPFEDGWNKSNLPRHEQYRKFVVSRFVATSKRLEHVARSQAPSGQGIAVQPIAFNTHDQNLLSAHVADSAGDFVAIGAYQTPLTRDSSAQYFPWDPFLKRGPILHNFNYGAVEGKPLLVYETSFFSPYAYRSEWAFVMLGLAASQDWDAVYLYAYGQPNIIYRGDGGNQGYGQSPLPIPISMDSRSGRNYTFGFHHGGDEILVAAWMLGGWGFVGGGLLPSMKTVKYRFGAGNLYGLPPGYCSSASGCAQGSKPVIHEMNNASLQAKLRISFDENLTHGKTCNPCEFSNPSAQIQVTDSIVWDTKNSRAIFDSPRFKAVGGQLEGKVSFKGGINVTFNRPVFGSFGLYAADGRALEESLDIRVVAAGSSQNTDFRFSPAKINFDLPYGAIAGVLNPGRAPVQITRPDLNTVLPGKKGKLSRYNFALEKYAHSEFDGQLAISSTELFFFGRIER